MQGREKPIKFRGKFERSEKTTRASVDSGYGGKHRDTHTHTHTGREADTMMVLDDGDGDQK